MNQKTGACMQVAGPGQCQRYHQSHNIIMLRCVPATCVAFHIAVSVCVCVWVLFLYLVCNRKSRVIWIDWAYIFAHYCQMANFGDSNRFALCICQLKYQIKPNDFIMCGPGRGHIGKGKYPLSIFASFAHAANECDKWIVARHNCNFEFH